MDYGDGRIEKLTPNIETPGTEAAAFGIMLAYYEIIIDEVIKGKELLLDASVLTVQMAESPDVYEVFAWLAELRDGEHLFFLQHHKNNTYLIRGSMFDLKKMAEAFYYLDYETGSTKYVSVFGSENAHAFLKSIDAIID